MIDIPTIKRACIELIEAESEDDDQVLSASTFRAVATPDAVLEMAMMLEKVGGPDELEEMLGLMRQLVDVVDQLEGEEARMLVMRAKVYTT